MGIPSVTTWRRWVRRPSHLAAALGAIAVLGGCATPSGQFEFGVIGDAPYILAEEPKVAAAIAEMNRSDLAFVVHVGDIQADPRVPFRGGIPTCTDESLQRRKELFDASRHPFILTPGDNDWTDCHHVKGRTVDPIERLARFRHVFFASAESLGQRKLTAALQSAEPGYAKFVENRLWTHGGVVFATLHLVGSNNNRGRTAEMDAEYAERNAANLAWLARAFNRARHEQARAIVIVTQANPLFETTWSPTQVRRYLLGLPVTPPKPPPSTGFDDFLAALEREVAGYPRPVLLVHGDTHVFRVDKPMVRAADKRLVEHFTRLETFGYPEVHWVRVRVDPADPGVFTIKPQMLSP